VTNRGNGPRARAPLQSRSRRRWLLAAGIAGLWLAFLMDSGSMVASSVLLLLLGVIAGCLVFVLRTFGFGRDHPWFQRAASRPWRDGRDVLQVALRHLSEVFVVTPHGSLLAPNAVELRMNPEDVESLAELIDLSLVNASAAEAYAAEVAACSAKVVRDVPLEVCVVADPEVPPGRYRLRQRAAPGALSLAAAPVSVVDLVGVATNHYHDGRTQSDQAMLMAGGTTVTETALNPLLRLVTDGAVAQTRVSGARAGRGDGVELRLPVEPTVSRVHATFTCTGGEWRISVLGRNGLVLNGVPLTGEHVIRDGDSIRWGRQSSAPVSTVSIG
jgi:hypothetical protein